MFVKHIFDLEAKQSWRYSVQVMSVDPVKCRALGWDIFNMEDLVCRINFHKTDLEAKQLWRYAISIGFI